MLATLPDAIAAFPSAPIPDTAVHLLWPWARSTTVISPVFANVPTVFPPVPHILPAVPDIFQPVSRTPVMPTVIDILGAVPDIFAPVPHVLSPVSHILPAIADALISRMVPDEALVGLRMGLPKSLQRLPPMRPAPFHHFLVALRIPVL